MPEGSSAVLSGLFCFENARALIQDKPLSLQLDAQGASFDGPTIRARFSYFNGHNDPLPTSPGDIKFYCATVNVVMADPSRMKIPDSAKTANTRDYNLIGDIIQCHLLPGDGQNPPISKDRTPVLLASGTVTESDKNAFTFALEVKQYSQILRGEGNIKIVVHVKDSPRLNTAELRRKVVPAPRSIVFVTGHFSHLAMHENSVSHMVVDFEGISFLGRSSVLNEPKVSPKKTAKDNAPPTGFSFNFSTPAKPSGSSSSSAPDTTGSKRSAPQEGEPEPKQAKVDEADTATGQGKDPATRRG